VKVEVVKQLPDFVCGLYGPLAIAVWEGLTTTQTAQVAAKMLTDHADREGKVIILGILGETAPPPDPKTREILAAGMARVGMRAAASATVIEGKGFRGAAMRAVLIGLGLVAKTPIPHRACATVQDAATFMNEHDSRLASREIINAVQTLRGRPHAERPL